MASWFEVGQLPYWDGPGVVHVTLHLSGWYDYKSDTQGLQHMLAGYISSFKKVAIPMGQEMLLAHLVEQTGKLVAVDCVTIPVCHLGFAPLFCSAWVWKGSRKKCLDKSR